MLVVPFLGVKILGFGTALIGCSKQKIKKLKKGTYKDLLTFAYNNAPFGNIMPRSTVWYFILISEVATCSSKV